VVPALFSRLPRLLAAVEHCGVVRLLQVEQVRGFEHERRLGKGREPGKRNGCVESVSPHYLPDRLWTSHEQHSAPGAADVTCTSASRSARIDSSQSFSAPIGAVSDRLLQPTFTATETRTKCSAAPW